MGYKTVRRETRTYEDSGRMLDVEAVYYDTPIHDDSRNKTAERNLKVIVTVNSEEGRDVYQDFFGLSDMELYGWDSFVHQDGIRHYFEDFADNKYPRRKLLIRKQSVAEEINTFLCEFVKASSPKDILELIEQEKNRRADKEADAAQMEVYMTIEDANGFENTLRKARYMTDAEKKPFADWCRDSMMKTVSDTIAIPMVNWSDMPKRAADGQFEGCNNQVWIISEDEWEYYVALNAKREYDIEIMNTQQEIEFLKTSICHAEEQKDLPIAEEAQRRMKLYNNTHNEGGEGFVPRVYSKDDYQNFQKRLGVMQTKWKRLHDEYPVLCQKLEAAKAKLNIAV